MTVAPIAIITALREISVLFAVAIGIFFFKENHLGKDYFSLHDSDRRHCHQPLAQW